MENVFSINRNSIRTDLNFGYNNLREQEINFISDEVIPLKSTTSH